jgi:hypothetical protein
MLQRRLAIGLEDRLRPTQYGSRQLRSTSQPLTILAVGMSSVYPEDPLYILLLDWSKAFDSISHESISNALNGLGIPEPFVQSILALYQTLTFSVKEKNQHFPPATSRKRCQTRMPSPYLFIVVLTAVLHDTQTYYEDKFGLIPYLFSALYPLWDLEYVDDTTILAPSSEVRENNSFIAFKSMLSQSWTCS